MSGLVKFGEKSQNVKPAGNHPYYFIERSDHVKQDIRLVWSIYSRRIALIFQKMKNFADPEPFVLTDSCHTL